MAPPATAGDESSASAVPEDEGPPEIHIPDIGEEPASAARAMEAAESGTDDQLDFISNSTVDSTDDPVTRSPAESSPPEGEAGATMGGSPNESGLPAADSADLVAGIEVDRRKIQDDVDSELMPLFLGEADELCAEITETSRNWRQSPNDERSRQGLKRALHTLKGSARMAGAIRLGELTHLMETRIELAIEAGAVDEGLFAELEEKLDRLSIDLERMVGGPEPKAAPAAPEEAEEAARAEPPLAAPAAMLRIHADTLDHLINDSGEVSIARSRIEGELRAVRQSVGDLSESVARLRGQLREVEIQADSQMQSRLSVLEERDRDFDPLEFDRYTRLQELTRLMAESLHDATSIQQALLKNLGETDAALAHQSRISRDVQQELMRMRAVPFSILDERLYRITRQTARELGKQAELEVRGSQVELDRSVLERVSAPLEHMLRNALVHGIESPPARERAGKPAIGRIGVVLRQESNEIVLTVSDDGAGIDLERLRDRAVQRGLLAPDDRPDAAALKRLFDEEHMKRYAFNAPQEPAEIVSLHSSVIGTLDKPVARKLRGGAAGKPAKRKVFMAEDRGYVDTPVYVRNDLVPGQRILGPALVEEYASTTVIFPGDRLEVSDHGDLVITIGRR